MAPYDSDDSLDDEQEFTETDVLLGYASKDGDGETISRLGGRPDWLDPSQPPSSALARCKVCNDLLVLLLQLNGELPNKFPGHDRRLYVFSCRRKSCRRREGSTRALRGVRISPEAAARVKARQEKEQREKEEQEKAEKERKEKDKGLGEALFGVQGKGLLSGAGGAPVNPFSAGGGSGSNVNPFAKPGTAAANPFSAPGAGPTSTQEKAPEPEPEPIPTKYSTKDLPKTFAETLSLNNPQQTGPPPPPEPWPPEAEQPKPYPISYLAEADYETLDPTPAPKDMPPQNIEIDDGSAAGGSGAGEDKNVFESTIDSTFQKFADRLAQNPDQCIRYEFAGQPLLYSKTDAVGKRLHDGGRLPPCGNCRGERVFEVQLVPGAIAELESEEEGLEGMDWGTVIVGVCASDCVPRGTAEGEAGYLEEWVGVQWEELTQRR
ncbi:hypothetical protein VP1G_07210 [Cytospora mali]|uniref:Programmed cell death protein 2 C-terminal domain-containing protein n=1 Tax=Cytospora mali TaxID=578113 RepID=A0A194V7T4_CYTMA|nr:hypothetical protein VP1G_07210 [Valsa mali var. pyri (nom. inval.)]